jgi:uncharacterized DUF497 family protein
VKHTTTLWDLDDDPHGNVQHIAQHGVTKEEVEEVLDQPTGREVSRSSGWPVLFGETSGGRLIAVVYDEIDPDTIRPVTADEVEA